MYLQRKLTIRRDTVWLLVAFGVQAPTGGHRRPQWRNVCKAPGGPDGQDSPWATGTSALGSGPITMFRPEALAA